MATGLGSGPASAQNLFQAFSNDMNKAFGSGGGTQSKRHGARQGGDARQRQVENERRRDGQVSGAVVGGLLGAGVGALVGGDNRAGAAIAGGIVGAGVGAAVGDAKAQDVNNQTRRISAEQSSLRQARAEASARADHYRQAHAAADSEASAQSARLRTLQGQYDSGQTTREELTREVARTRDQQRAVQTQIQNVDTDIEKAQRASTGSKGVNSEITKLRAEKERLRQVEKKLIDAGDAAERTTTAR